jgi:cyanophycinase-like exopeptidase
MRQQMNSGEKLLSINHHLHATTLILQWLFRSYADINGQQHYQERGRMGQITQALNPFFSQHLLAVSVDA